MADDFVDMDALPTSSDGALDDVQHQEPVAPQQPAPTDAETTSAKSSDAQPGDDKFDPLKIVRDVVDKSRKEAVTASPAETEAEGGKPQDGAVTKKPDDENYTDTPFHKHPRFQDLLRAKKANEADAGRYRNVQNYLDQNRLSATEAADGLMIMGLAKTDPVACWKLLAPFAEKIAYAAGVAIPPDLQAEVDKGILPPAAALRLAAERAQRVTAQGQMSFQQQQQEQRQIEERRNSLVSAGTDWETDRTRKDPNFGSKVEAIMKEVHWLQRTEGRPETPEGVRAQLEKAYKAVNASLPNPVRQNGARPVTPLRGGQVNGSTSAEPKSTLDRIKMIREQASA